MKHLLLSGRVIDVLDKEDYDIWIPKIAGLIMILQQIRRIKL
jgi:hypothetical protein